MSPPHRYFELATPRFLARRPARTTRRSFGPAGWSFGPARWPFGPARWPFGPAGWSFGTAGWSFGTTRRSFGTTRRSAGTFRSTPFLHGYQPPSTITGCQAEPWFDTRVPLLLSLSVVAPLSLALGRLLYVLIIPVPSNHLPLSIQGRGLSVLRESEPRRHSPGTSTLASSCEA